DVAQRSGLFVLDGGDLVEDGPVRHGGQVGGRYPGGKPAGGLPCPISGIRHRHAVSARTRPYLRGRSVHNPITIINVIVPRRALLPPSSSTAPVRYTGRRSPCCPGHCPAGRSPR